MAMNGIKTSKTALLPHLNVNLVSVISYRNCPHTFRGYPFLISNSDSLMRDEVRRMIFERVICGGKDRKRKGD